jgi:homoserine kinase
MVKQSSVTVRVPASTANLGPGFDCLGMALDIWNEVQFQISDEDVVIEIEGEGVSKLPRDRSNLIYQAFTRLYEKAGIPIPEGVVIKCKNYIPTSSGLGSSASAVIAGLLAARQLSGAKISDNDLLSLAVEFEGHADNAAACLWGGLVIVIQNVDDWLVEKVQVKPIKVVIALPEINLSTRQARALLPDSVRRQDAIFNIGHTALLIHALKDGKTELLAAAMQDRLHQPYRLKKYPGVEEAMRLALHAGAFSAALSGAGPSLIAFTNDFQEKIGKVMLESFTSKNIPARIFSTQTITKSAYTQ